MEKIIELFKRLSEAIEVVSGIVGALVGAIIGIYILTIGGKDTWPAETKPETQSPDDISES